MSFMYDGGRQRFLEGSIAWLSDTINVIPVTSSYVANQATHTMLSDVVAGNRVGSPQTLGTKSSTGGVADAADTTFPTVSGSAIAALVVYKVGGTEATSPLIAYIDAATGLPVTPNGGDILITWDNGANKIFKL